MRYIPAFLVGLLSIYNTWEPHPSNFPLLVPLSLLLSLSSPPPSLSPLHRFGGYILAGLQRKFLKVKNFSFSYYERPPSTLSENSTTLLFLHGFTSNKESWVRVTQNLPKSWRIIVLDMPGHGESSFDPKLDYSMFGMAEKVHLVCFYCKQRVDFSCVQTGILLSCS